MTLKSRYEQAKAKVEIKYEQVKDDFKSSTQKYYICGLTVVVVGTVSYVVGSKHANFTSLIMRDIDSQRISPCIAGTASRGIAVTGQNVVMNNVSLISSNRSGPPSWVVRCLETGNIFTSQHAAAIEMDLREVEISRHLNGLRDHVRGYTFERICLAA